MRLVEAVIIVHAYIIQQKDLSQEMGRRVIQHRVQGPYQRVEVLIVEDHDNASVWQVRWILLMPHSTAKNKTQTLTSETTSWKVYRSNHASICSMHFVPMDLE
eukprot:1717027-Amphidinium_carterae.1